MLLSTISRTTVADWAQILGGIGTILGGVAFGVRSIAKKITEQIREVQAELTPNGGSSLKDGVNRIECEVNRQGTEIDSLARKFERHLGWHDAAERSAS